jgi:hypothetical protein
VREAGAGALGIDERWLERGFAALIDFLKMNIKLVPAGWIFTTEEPVVRGETSLKG